MSLREFAIKCGISHTHLDSIEKGKDPRTGKPVSVSYDLLSRIANSTGVSVSYLTGNSIGDLIQKRRQTLGMSLSDLAVKMGKSTEEIESYENNFPSQFPPELIDKFAEALDTTRSYLLGRSLSSEISHGELSTIHIGDEATLISTESPEDAAVDFFDERATRLVMNVVKEICTPLSRLHTPSGVEIPFIDDRCLNIVIDFLERNADLLKAHITASKMIPAANEAQREAFIEGQEEARRVKQREEDGD
jgi:transcriptional regulator with XRE-family HTH domain